jgi:phospholipase C
MLVVSPWSTGGWVCSETFDHTSIIRLMEQRFGVHEPNITPWRRSVCGDLTSAFDFSGRSSTAPALPHTGTYQPHDHERHPDYRPTPPTDGTTPSQEPGTRPVGYDLTVQERPGSGSLKVSLLNDGPLGAHFQARLLVPPAPPRSYTVGAGDRLTADWPAVGAYDVELHGPNSLFRRFTGDRSRDHTAVTIHERNGAISVLVTTERPATVVLANALAPRHPRRASLRAGHQHRFEIPLRETGGWYDVTVSVEGTTFARQFAGHVENGTPSISNPALGW